VNGTPRVADVLTKTAQAAATTGAVGMLTTSLGFSIFRQIHRSHSRPSCIFARDRSRRLVLTQPITGHR